MIDWPLVVLCLLTGAINLIGALAYAARIAGVRTRRIAMSFALFNVLVLVSRLSNSFLAPLAAKRVENGIVAGGGEHLLADFRWIMGSATVGVLLGILLVPTFQRLFAAAIGAMQKKPSVARLALRSMSPGGLAMIRQSIAPPRVANLQHLKRPKEAGWGILVANALAQALLAVGVFASLYAGYLGPDFRVTASQLSAVINGVATILLFVLIDPQLSILTDDVIDGSLSEAAYRRVVTWISLSRLAGTVLAQAAFVPAAMLIAWIAARI
ncbi:lipid II flippase Amj family protein [Tsuneonella sp. HG222]